MSGMANQIRERMAADDLDTSGSVADAMGGSPAQGTGGDPNPTPDPASSAGTSNTGGQGGGTPDTIPYSRFTEVNSRLQELRQYEQLERMGIDPDSAVRLASFEQAYIQDPTGTIARMVDQLGDLPDAQKTALKALLQQQQQGGDGAADVGDGDGGTTVQIPDEVKEAIDWVREQRAERNNADSQARLESVLSHWRQLDDKDQVKVSERQRLMYVQTAAGSGRQFTTVEELAEAARDAFLEDRDVTLGSAVVRRGPGTPLAVPSGGLPPTQAITPKSMAEARKLIQADIAAGRLPDLSPQ